MRDGTKHSSEEYARKRIRNLTARIDENIQKHPSHVLRDGRTVFDRVHLDRIALAGWYKRLAEITKGKTR